MMDPVTLAYPDEILPRVADPMAGSELGVLPVVGDRRPW